MRLRRAADPRKARTMQAYMKSSMPYYGVPVAAVREICRQLLVEFDFSDRRAWQAAILCLWRHARYREERYCALYLCGHRSARAHHVPAILRMYEEMIVTGAWWDYVDDIADRIGMILANSPRSMRSKMLSWSRSRNMWKRRTAIISQLALKERTDVKLLYACIEPSLASGEFFLRKAIGWALRQYARTNPREVARYVRNNRQRLSGLSQREALRNIPAQRA
jgi:3-methyladenine DNA glycosylase AlkD